MTIAGIVARPHSVFGFAPGNNYANPGVALGGVFSAFVEVNVRTTEAPLAEEQYAGSYNGVDGWMIGRDASKPLSFLFRNGPNDFTFDLEPSIALDRSFLLGMSSDGVTTQITVNGGIVGSMPAAAAGTGPFSVGGDATRSTRDAIVFAAYTSSTYTAAQWADVWAWARRYAEVSAAALPELYWQALPLFPGQGSVVAPATWVNQGTLGAAGDLTFSGAGNLTFQDDPHGAFTGLVRPYNADGPLPLLTALDIYLVPAPVGNDANDGLSPTTPVATLAGAYSKVPTVLLGAAVRIHVAAGTYDWATIPGYFAVNSLGQVILVGDGAGQPGENGFQAPAETGTAGATTNNVLVDWAATGGPDSLASSSLRFTTGAAVGQIRTIRNNTATEIFLEAEFNPAPAPGDDFEVLQPAAVFTSAGDIALATENQLPVSCANLVLAPTGFVRVEDQLCLKTYGVIFAGNLQVLRSCVAAGAANNDASAQPLYLVEYAAAMAASPIPFYGAESGWGLQVYGAVTVANALQGYLFCVNLDLAATVEDQLVAFYGGAIFAGAQALINAKITFASQGNVPTLVRSGSFPVLFMPFGGEVVTLGGDASLLVEDVAPPPGLPTILAESFQSFGTLSLTAASDNVGLLCADLDVTQGDLVITMSAAAATQGLAVARHISIDQALTIVGGGDINSFGLVLSTAVGIVRGDVDVSGCGQSIVVETSQIRFDGSVTLDAPVAGLLANTNSDVAVQGAFAFTSTLVGQPNCFGLYATDTSRVTVRGTTNIQTVLGTVATIGVNAQAGATIALEDLVTVFMDGANDPNICQAARANAASIFMDSFQADANTMHGYEGIRAVVGGSVMVARRNSAEIRKAEVGVVAEFQGRAEYPGVVTDCNVGAAANFDGSSVAVFGANNINTIALGVTAGSGALAEVTGTPPNIAAGGDMATILLGSDSAPPIPYITYGVYVQNSRASIQAALAGDGNAIVAKGSASVATSSSVTSNLQDALVADTGANIEFLVLDAGPHITAPAGNGVNCTGGGRMSFDLTASIPPAFGAIGGDELVVGPGALEQSSFALALPSAGDAFSNAGAGSVVTRLG